MIADMAFDLEAVLQRLAVPRVHLVAHSMGGKTACYWAALYPSSVERMVIIDVSPGANPESVSTIELMELIDTITLNHSGVQSPTQADVYLQPLIRNARLRQFMVDSISFQPDKPPHWTFDAKNLRSNMHHIMTFEPPRGLGAFPRPVKFLKGSRSPYLRPEDHGAIMSELFPQHSIVMVDGATHWMHYEQPHRVISEAASFLG